MKEMTNAKWQMRKGQGPRTNSQAPNPNNQRPPSANNQQPMTSRQNFTSEGVSKSKVVVKYRGRYFCPKSRIPMTKLNPIALVRFSLAFLLVAGCGSATLSAPTASPTALSPESTRTETATPRQAAAYYVDCAQGNDAHDGLGPKTAWQTPGKINATTFIPGDSILLKRGTVCHGMFWPQGSGAEGAPITLGAYGKGSLPIIVAGEDEAAIKLSDQEYWHIQDVETIGGNLYGIWVSGKVADKVLHHFRITNVLVHDVGGVASAEHSKDTGLIILRPFGKNEVLQDVLIDGATADNTQQWSGILVFGGGADEGGANIIVRNSSAHTVYGDGIVVHAASDVLMEHNVAYDTGNAPPGYEKLIGTPSAIWNWYCYRCTVQFNEGYLSHSPQVDAGIYDIDWHSQEGLVQYNYGHDADGYCAAIFGAEGNINVNSTIRYNVCSNNARDDTNVTQGDIYLSTWNDGFLDGVRIYNNTFYWNPIRNYGLLQNKAMFKESRPNFFKNNLIYSTASYLIETNGGLQLDHNLYWYTGPESGRWVYDGVRYTDFKSYQAGSGQDAHGLYADPKLNDPTYHAVDRPTTSFTLQPDSPAIDAGADVGDMG